MEVVLTSGMLVAGKNMPFIHDGAAPKRSLPMLSGHEKINIGVFAKRFKRVTKNSV